jgi:nucleoside-diphosphate-sugar epimerase
MSNILIVGGAGYVGGAVTDLLAGGEHSIRVFDMILYEDSYRKPIDFIYGDVRDRAALKPHLDWADVVVWLAAIVGDGACQLDPDTTIAVNQQTVEWLANNYDKRIVFMSTCSVYGAQDVELDEESAKNPLSLYASTKLQAETYLADKDAIIFRLGTLFG